MCSVCPDTVRSVKKKIFLLLSVYREYLKSVVLAFVSLYEDSNLYFAHVVCLKTVHTVGIDSNCLHNMWLYDQLFSKCSPLAMKIFVSLCENRSLALKFNLKLHF